MENVSLIELLAQAEDSDAGEAVSIIRFSALTTCCKGLCKNL
jgi:hypothetical protein